MLLVEVLIVHVLRLARVCAILSRILGISQALMAILRTGRANGSLASTSRLSSAARQASARESVSFTAQRPNDLRRSTHVKGADGHVMGRYGSMGRRTRR